MKINIKHIRVGGWHGLIEVELNNGQVFFWTFRQILAQERLETKRTFEGEIDLLALLGLK